MFPHCLQRHCLTGPDCLPQADVWGSFTAVLDGIASGYPSFDLLMITGDVAQDEQLETYLRVRDILAARGWLEKTRLIPGKQVTHAIPTTT